MSFVEKVKDSVSNVFYDHVSQNINFAKFVATSLKGFSIEQWVFTISTIFVFGVIIVNSDPTSSKLLVYGKNLTNPAPRVDHNHPAVLPPALYNYVDKIVAITVPKKFFLHFYVLFTTLVLVQQFCFWNLENEIYPQVNAVVSSFYNKWYKIEEFDPANYSLLYVVNNLLMVQAFKRLYENIYVAKFSDARINILHYVFGMGFYVLVCLVNFGGLAPFYINESNTLYEVNLELPDWLFIALFLFYSADQFQNHVHLASLKKYTIPTFRFFEWTASAHYFDEIVMYGVLLRFYWACENLFWLKWAFSSVFLLVVGNLSVLARETWKYYQLKFGDQFKIPYKLVPYLW